MTLLASCGDSRFQKADDDGNTVMTRSAVLTPPPRPSGGPVTGYEHIISNLPFESTPSQSNFYTSGTIPGEGQVVDGQYHYRIPLTTPRGIAGLEPELALEYSSSRANGPVGVGWAIEGISAITRCTHSAARDGFVSGFDFNADHTAGLNQYCLDGNLLIPIEVTRERVVYQTERADLSRVLAVYEAGDTADPTRWIVYKPDGRQFHYGEDNANTNSRVDGPLGGATTNPNGGHWTYAWYLSHAWDLDTNKITFRYQTDPGGYNARQNTTVANARQGDTRYIQSIEYGNTQIGFDWMDRADQIESYAFGFDLSVSKRLNLITVNRIDPAAGPVRTFTYVFTYLPSPFTGRSVLSSLQMSDRSVWRLPETKFTWNWGTSSYSTSAYETKNYQIGPSGCPIVQGQSSCLPENFTRPIVADFDGDGIDDVLYSVNDLGTTAYAFNQRKARLRMRRGSPTGLGTEIDPIPGTAGAFIAVDLAHSSAADFDGDGAMELILAVQTTATTSPYYDYVPYRWVSTQLSPIAATAGLAIVAAKMNKPTPKETTSWNIADANGDGLPDVILQNPRATNGIYLGLPSDATHLYNMKTTPLSGPPVNIPTFWADTDGDARTDAIKQSSSRGLFFYDINNDGLADFINSNPMLSVHDCGGAATQTVQLVAAVNYGRPATWLGSFPYGINQAVTLPPPSSACVTFAEHLTNPTQDLPMEADYGASMRLGDFNGDGRTDYLLLNVALDAGTQVYQRSDGDDIGNVYTQDQYKNINAVPQDRRFTAIVRPKATAYLQNPVLLLSSVDQLTPGSLGYTTTTLPSSARVREDRFAKIEVWRGSARDPGFPVDTWRGHYWNGTSVGDINGDGLMDIVQLAATTSGTELKIETVSAKLAADGVTTRKDVIVAVKNGLASLAPDGDSVAEKIAYADLSKLATSGRYGRASTCFPNATIPDVRAGCLTHGLVVDTYRPGGRLPPFGVGKADFGDIQYTYNSARFDRKGRGFLGFDSITAWDRRYGSQKTVTRTFKGSTFVIQTDDFGLRTYATSTNTVHDDPTFPSYVNWNTGFESGQTARLFYPSTITKTVTQSGTLVDPLFPGYPATGPFRRDTTTTNNTFIANVPNGTSYSTTRVHLVRPSDSTTNTEYAANVGRVPSAPVTPYARILKTSWLYDTFSNPTQVTKTSSDGNNVISSTDSTVVEYDNVIEANNWAIGQPKSVTRTRSADGGSATRKITLTHFPNHRLETKTVSPTGGADLKKTTTYAYYSNGQLKSESVSAIDAAIDAQTPQVRKTTYAYDATGIYPATVTNANDQVTTYTYDPGLGVPISVVDPNNTGVDYVYDGFGRRRCTFPDDGSSTCTARPVGGTTEPGIGYHTLTYIPWPGPGCEFSLNGACFVEKRQETFDTRGNKVLTAGRSMNGALWDTIMTYDSRNRIASKSQPKGGREGPATTQYDTRYSYDALDRIVGLQNPDATTQSWSYPQLFKVTHKDEVGAQVSTTFNVDDQLVLSEEQLTTPTVHTVSTSTRLGAFGNPVAMSVTDGSSNKRTTNMSYDELGHRLTETTPATGTTTNSYNGFGELRKVSSSAFSRVYVHDRLGRIASSADPNNASNNDQYTWDTKTYGIGKLGSTKSMPDGVVESLEYTPVGQVASQTVAPPNASYTVSFTYDAQGRTSHVRYPSPVKDANAYVEVANSYNPVGVLNSVDLVNPSNKNLWKLTAETPLETDEVAGDNSATQTIVNPITMRTTDINVSGPTWNTNYAYGNDGQVTGRIIKSGGSEIDETFLYDDIKRLKTWTHSNAITHGVYRREYAYNDFGDMTSATTYPALTGGTASLTETYTMNVMSPRTIPGAVSGDTTVLGSSTYTYDSSGRRTKKTTAGVATNFTGYNHWNLPTGINSGATSISYLYDAFGRRAVKNVSGNPTYYVGDWFRDQALGSQHTFVSFIKGHGKNVAEIVQPSSFGTPSNLTIWYPHADLLGSSSMLTSPTDAPHMYYEPFGNRIDATTTTPQTPNQDYPIGFAGHESDDFGLINMKGRLYDPTQRRFLTPDPFITNPARSQGYAPYSYVGNDPINRIDPTGLWWGEDLASKAWNSVMGRSSVEVPLFHVQIPVGYLMQMGGNRDGLEPAFGWDDYHDSAPNGDEVDSRGTRVAQVAENDQPTRGTDGLVEVTVHAPGPTTIYVPAPDTSRPDPFGLLQYMRPAPTPAPSGLPDRWEAMKHLGEPVCFDMKTADKVKVPDSPQDEISNLSPEELIAANKAMEDFQERLEAVAEFLELRSKTNEATEGLPSLRPRQWGQETKLEVEPIP